jgi:hypothetical protein
MKLYHGSIVDISKIDLAKSKPNKDFGKAFYLSEKREQAIEMAQFKAETFGGSVIINEFEFDESALAAPDFKFFRFDSYTEEWARFVLANRSSNVTNHDYDIVFGPIANDKIGRQIFNFQSGYIDFDTFIKRIQYPEGITFQWAFCTEKAIQKLHSL